MSTIKNQAIQTALVGDWQTAISLNKIILEEDPNDIDTLNRLAYAFMSTGNAKDAKNLYEKVLGLDMKNPIALRNLKRLTEVNTKRLTVTINNIFIEEPGKTKVIELTNVADKKILTLLRSGEKLFLRIKRNKLFVLDLENQYIGMFPDDISQRLIKFMEAGNEYESYVRNAESNKVCIFIRETKRVKRFKNQPSFVSSDKARAPLENHQSSKSQTHSSNESV